MMRMQGCGFLPEDERASFDVTFGEDVSSDGICPTYYVEDPSMAYAIGSAFALVDGGVATSLRSPAVLIDAKSLIRGTRADWNAERAAEMAEARGG